MNRLMDRQVDGSHRHTVGVVGIYVGAGDVPPLDVGVDAAAEALLPAGGHGQRQHRTAAEERHRTLTFIKQSCSLLRNKFI